MGDVCKDFCLEAAIRLRLEHLEALVKRQLGTFVYFFLLAEDHIHGHPRGVAIGVIGELRAECLAKGHECGLLGSVTLFSHARHRFGAELIFRKYFRGSQQAILPGMSTDGSTKRKSPEQGYQRVQGHKSDIQK
eukprot:1334488-Amorphochlora_amoeboformis.AAC.1